MVRVMMMVVMCFMVAPFSTGTCSCGASCRVMADGASAGAGSCSSCTRAEGSDGEPSGTDTKQDPANDELHSHGPQLPSRIRKSDTSTVLSLFKSAVHGWHMSGIPLPLASSHVAPSVQIPAAAIHSTSVAMSHVSLKKQHAPCGQASGSHKVVSPRNTPPAAVQSAAVTRAHSPSV
jgi:hypothetical protein